jgi:hypothetical protein
MTIGIELHRNDVFSNFDYVEGNVTVDLEIEENVKSIEVILEGLS